VFVEEMNRQGGRARHMPTAVRDPTGDSTPGNVSSARDPGKLVNAAHGYEAIASFRRATDHGNVYGPDDGRSATPTAG